MGLHGSGNLHMLGSHVAIHMHTQKSVSLWQQCICAALC